MLGTVCYLAANKRCVSWGVVHKVFVWFLEVSASACVVL